MPNTEADPGINIQFQVAYDCGCKGFRETAKLPYRNQCFDIIALRLAKIELSDEARERQNDLRERRAQHDYEVGQFYEERERYSSAVVHYAAVIDAYSDTSWAPMAAERIAVLEDELE